MRVYTKYRFKPARKAAAGNHLQWFLITLLGVFLAWIWWKNLQPPPRSTASDQTGRVAVTPIFRATRNGVTNLASPLAMARSATLGEQDTSTPGPHQPKNGFELQVALARQGISCGSLDGVVGSQTRAALRAFQQNQRLRVTGELDQATKARLLLLRPTQKHYAVTADDLGRLAPVGTTWLAKSLQDRLEYESILELVAEKHQCHPNFIRMLNPSVDWNRVGPGTELTVPDVEYPAPSAKAAFVRIRLAEKSLAVYDRQTNLLAYFPCSIARQVEKRPVGRLQVESVVLNPNYKFSPEIFPESEEGRLLKHPLMIPKGPNNPVGTAWIGLSRPGYGIHGTPRPEDVGRTESHGCFRLANWNAEYLAELVEVGTPVIIDP